MPKQWRCLSAVAKLTNAINAERITVNRLGTVLFVDLHQAVIFFTVFSLQAYSHTVLLFHWKIYLISCSHFNGRLISYQTSILSMRPISYHIPSPVEDQLHHKVRDQINEPRMH